MGTSAAHYRDPYDRRGTHRASGAAHHAGHPWSAAANPRIDSRRVVATAGETAGKEAVARLRTGKAARARDDTPRTTAPPCGATAEDSPTA